VPRRFRNGAALPIFAALENPPRLPLRIKKKACKKREGDTNDGRQRSGRALDLHNGVCRALTIGEQLG